MKHSKRIFLTFLLTILSLAIFESIHLNLRSYSIYYASNLPRCEGQHPEWIMLAENMAYVPHPDTDIYRYDYDGPGIVYRDKTGEYFTIIGNFPADTDSVSYVYKRNKNELYIFNKNFKLIYGDFKSKSIDLNTVDEEEILSNLEELLEPIIDVQFEPEVNLQPLFNYLNKDLVEDITK